MGIVEQGTQDPQKAWEWPESLNLVFICDFENVCY